MSPYRILIIIPAYGAAAELAVCLQSLEENMPAGCEILVLDDATPDNSVARAAAEFEGRIPGLRYFRQSANLGFVENCNTGLREAMDSGRDALLLNTDTRITAGAIEEMHAVLHFHEKHGAVSPRSNNATIFSVPVFEKTEPEESYALWMRIREYMPRFSIMPTCVGFCMLIRNEVLRFFGLLDPVYSPGYNEENDLACRMNRRGYSAVAANHAFVFHFESASFGSRRKSLETRNRAILDERFPEYGRTVQEYFRYHFDPVERFAPLWREGRRKRILIDLYHLPAHHSGTSEFGLNLLLRLAPLLEPKYEIAIGISPEARGFFETELVGYSIFDESRSAGALFDAVFKPCQLFFWQDLHRMARLGARLAATHQDSIAVRCRYLAAPSVEILHSELPGLLEKIITISQFSKRDFEALYGENSGFEVIYQGTEERPAYAARAEGYVLIIGNRFAHKALDQTVEILAGVAPLVVLGGDRPRDLPQNVEWKESGRLGRTDIIELYENSAVVAYPSYYEGFGLPVLDGLAAGRQVVALDTELSRELAALTRDPKLRLVATHREMRRAVQEALQSLKEGGVGEARPQRTWEDVARDYAASLEELLERKIDVELLRWRWKLLAAMDTLANLQG